MTTSMAKFLPGLQETAPSIVQELTFLAQQTGQDETTLLSRALRLGLNLLYHQTVERAFIEGELSPGEACTILGPERVADLEYAQQALQDDVTRGLGL